MGGLKMEKNRNWAGSTSTWAGKYTWWVELGIWFVIVTGVILLILK